MNYPSIKEYKEAIFFAENNFKQLKNLRPLLDEYGSPVITIGNSSVVFKMKEVQTGKLYAVKCFLKEQEGQSDSISSKYLENELYVYTDATDKRFFPVILMEWIESEAEGLQYEEGICLAYCSEDSQACEDKDHASWQPHTKIIKKNCKLGVVVDDGNTKKQIIPFNYDTWFDYDGHETDIKEDFFDNYLDYIGYFAIRNTDSTYTCHGYDKDGNITESFICESFNADVIRLNDKTYIGRKAEGEGYDDVERMGYYYGQLGNDNCYYALRKGNKWSLASDDLKEIYIDYIECDRFREIGWTPKGYYAILVIEDKYKLCIGQKDGQSLTLPNEYDYIVMRYCMTNDGCRVEGLCFTIRNGEKWAVCSNDLLQLSPFIFDDIGYMINSNSITVFKELNNRKVELVYNINGVNAWNVKDIRLFSIDEIEAVKRAEVVPSQYGNSVCFFMKSGGQIYIPLYEKSSLTSGDTVDLKNAILITLCREGNDDIYRVLE